MERNLNAMSMDARSNRGFVSIDLDYNIKEIDQNACEILQVEFQEVQGTSIDNLLPHFDSNLKHSFLNHIKNKEEQVPFDLIYHDKESDFLKRLEMVYSNIRDVDNQVMGGIIMLKHTLLSKKMKVGKNSTNEKVQQDIPHSPDLSAFYKIVIHELTKPLEVIHSASIDCLSDKNDLTETSVVNLNRINESTKKLQNVLSDLIKLMNVSDTDIKEQEVDINQISKKIFNNLCTTDPERKANLQIEDSLICEGDKGLIEILLTNLIRNAWTYSENKTETIISIGKVSFGEFEYFYIRDNGKGFDSNEANKLFTPFSKLNNKNNVSNTGLGLSIAKKIVSLHRGRIWADGEPNKGATFYFILKEKEIKPKNLSSTHEMTA